MTANVHHLNNSELMREVHIGNVTAVHEAVVASGDRETGITIHMVSEECDGGKIVFQATTAVEAGDTASDVAGKVHALEYKYYPEVVERVIRSM